MYKIIKDGETIAITEKINYIKQSQNGFFIRCSENDAQGVAFENKAYNIIGRKQMPECEAVVIVEIDGGAHIKDGEDNQTETDALIVDHEYRLTLIEMGVFE